MLTNAYDFIIKTTEDRPVFSCFLLASIVLILDFITGQEIYFPIVYALPVGVAAWHNKKYLAYALAILLPLARISYHFLWNDNQSLPSVLLNPPIKILSLLFYAYLIDRVSWQKKKLEEELLALEGILPMCASCRKIRNENGQYEPLEKFVVEHSKASFSHGICPECAKKLYPDIYDKIMAADNFPHPPSPATQNQP